MAKPYKPRRSKLKAHDAGRNRHHKGLSLLLKQTRKATERASGMQVAAARRKRRNTAEEEK